MLRSGNKLLLLGLLAGCAGWSTCSPAGAQTLKPGVDDMRRNLQTAARAAGLESPGTPPFRIEASFDTFDYEGKPDGSGTLKEEWLNSGSSRRVITFRGVTLTQVASGGTVRVSGESFQSSYMEHTLIDALLQPAPSAQELAAAEPEYKPLKLSTMTLDCLLVKPTGISEKANPADRAATGYCLSQSPLLIRLEERRYEVLVVYNHFAQLGLHTLARDIVVSTGAQTRGTLHVTTFQAAPELKENDFAIPPGPDTSAVDVAAHLDSGILQGALVSKVAPRYPDIDKQNHVAGRVTLHVLINKTGAIERLEVISAPTRTLAKASLDAVRQWKCKPYLLNGQPADVDTTITVIFSFAG